MGVQINFYMDNKLQQEFIKYIYECGYKIMDCMATDNKLNVYYNFNEVVYIDRPLYIFNPTDLNNIFVKSWGQIDPLNSNIIEFINTSISDTNMKILQGRIWIEKNIYRNGEKNLKSQSLIDLYCNLRKWIKKNTKYTLVGQSKQYVTDEIINLIAKGYTLN